MALDPSNNGTIGSRITAPSPTYPYGSSKDETGDGANDGTPYFKARADDIFGFQQAVLTEADIIPSGNADTALDSQYLQGLKQIISSLTGNELDNGNFDVWQERIALTLPDSAGSYVSDGWVNQRATGTTDVTRQNFIFGQTDVPGNPTHFMRVDKSVAEAIPTVPVEGRIEFVNTLAGEKTIFAFWARVAGADKTFKVQVNQNFGVGGSAAVLCYEDDITVTSDWQLFFITGDMPSVSGQTLGTGSYVNVAILEDSAFSTFTLDVAQAFFGRGDVVRKPLYPKREITLALCERLFWKSYDLNDLPGSATLVGALGTVSTSTNTGQTKLQVTPPTTMRVAPAVTLYNPVTGSVGSYDRSGVSVAAGVTGSLTGQRGFYITNTALTTDGQFHTIHCTANARL